MALEFSTWPVGSVDRYRKLAADMLTHDGGIGARQISLLALRARASDLADLDDAEVAGFIDVVLASMPKTVSFAPPDDRDPPPYDYARFDAPGIVDPLAVGKIVALPGKNHYVSSEKEKHLGQIRVFRGWRQGKTVSFEPAEVGRLAPIGIDAHVSFTYVKERGSGALRAVEIRRFDEYR